MAARKKLTQRQYLNVMTVTVAFMILIFVIIGKIMEDKVEPNIASLPFAEFTKMTLGDWHIVYKNEQWQQDPIILSDLELHQFVHSWQELAPYGWSNQAKGTTALSLELEISQQAQIWHLMLSDQPLLKFDNQEQAIILTKLQLSLLFPEKLLRSQVE